MKQNEVLQKDVQDAIRWEPLLTSTQIGVTAKDGIVTLSGTVDSYRKKMEAEDAAKSVSGVRALVENINIHLASFGEKDDTDIAVDVLNALANHWEVPKDKVRASVERGWVTLEGELEWNYQREAAKKSLNNLSGIKGITNNIKIRSINIDRIEKSDIEGALKRNWSVDSHAISVQVIGNKVTLNGTVHSFYQKDEAGRIAWNAPGVSAVDNELVITYN